MESILKFILVYIIPMFKPIKKPKTKVDKWEYLINKI